VIFAGQISAGSDTDRERFEHSMELSSMSGIGPVRRASGKKTDKKATIRFRRACLPEQFA
jgi:hypothetical protein